MRAMRRSRAVVSTGAWMPRREVDGGFRRGSDVLKGLALGAAAVCIGRPQRWGLAAFGAAGVQRILEILQTELVLAMAQTGRPTIASIDRTLVRTYFP